MKSTVFGLSVLLCLFALVPDAVVADDLVEFLTGAKMNGTVKAIRKDQKEFDFEANIGGHSVTRTYPFSKVHAVTLRGNRFELTPLSQATTATSASNDSETPTTRSKTEIERLINDLGSTLPDWFESTPLDYPKTLDLSWPIQPPDKGWNNQKNMGQYIWDVIHPNPARWHGGIKLVYHCMDLHQGDRALVQRDQETLGRMYFELLQDYPRAAYWLRKGGIEKGQRSAVMLAECYYRLGNRHMALQNLIATTYNAGAAATAVKLYGNMGELDAALKLTGTIANSSVAHVGFIAAGDALREAGRFDQAIVFYNRVLTDDSFRNDDYEQRFKARARESIEAIELFEKADVRSVDDGTYTAQSTGYNGALHVAVTVAGGRIESVKVTDHQEKQFYSALTDTESSILALQTVRGVDGTSGATITSRAIVNAAAKALATAGPASSSLSSSSRSPGQTP